MALPRVATAAYTTICKKEEFDGISDGLANPTVGWLPDANFSST
jgi:hypothetical protein